MPKRRRCLVRPPSRGGHYESPYTAVVFVDSVPYLITERRGHGFSARKLNADEADMVRTAFDDLHADLEARLGRRQRTRAHPKK